MFVRCKMRRKDGKEYRYWSVMIVSARCNFRCSRRFSASS